MRSSTKPLPFCCFFSSVYLFFYTYYYVGFKDVDDNRLSLIISKFTSLFLREPDSPIEPQASSGFHLTEQLAIKILFILSALLSIAAAALSMHTNLVSKRHVLNSPIAFASGFFLVVILQTAFHLGLFE